MKATVILLLGFVLATSQNDEMNKIIGNWEGTISIPAAGVELPVVFHIKLDDKGKLISTMDSPDQNAFGIKVDETSFKDGVLEMKINQAQGAYKGTLKEGSFEGTWTQLGQTFELKLKKAKRKGTS